MFSKLAWMMALLVTLAGATETRFTFNGFQVSDVNISLGDSAAITTDRILKLTSVDFTYQTGHAFYDQPITFKNSTNGSTYSFSTTFVFAITPASGSLTGHGLAFVITPTKEFSGALPSQYLGLFNASNNGYATNHIVAIELDTYVNVEFGDINDNHVGININGLSSVAAAPAGYYVEKTDGLKKLTLTSGQAMQVWVEYDGINRHINATLAPINVAKPNRPLLSLSYDISPIIEDTMYVGFSSSTGGAVLASHIILGWSFSMNSLKSPELDLSQLPKLPPSPDKQSSEFLVIGVPIFAVSLVIAVILGILYVIRWKRTSAEVLEEWELDYGSRRFKYKDLYIGTKGFGVKGLLGKGGFGRVYKCVLPKSKVEVAVKRVSHESRQGMKEFIAEIVSIGRLRHRNLVQLLGYCRRKGELLLVYDYMPNGSLDKYIYDNPRVMLNWRQRLHVIKGVASGLLYLHEEWEQVVIHRDVKASNVLLDNEFNGRLGDFGLARLYDHGLDSLITNVAGTFGYIAPEQTRTRKVTTSTDVFAFGVFLLEVACGRKPIEPQMADLMLVDWVISCWQRDDILGARDPNLGTDYASEEVELVLKLGLLCSHFDPAVRPCMRQVVQYLEGDALLPDLSSLKAFFNRQTSFTGKPLISHTSSITESRLSQGR